MKNLLLQSYISNIRKVIRRFCNEDINKQSKSEGSRSEQYLAAICACILMAACGACQEWSSPAVPHLTSNRSSIRVTDAQAVWVVSLYSLGDLFGALLNPLFIDRIGRKYTLLLFALPCLIGWILIIFAENFIYLYIARFISGISQGSAFISVPIYLTEISEKNIRGMQVNMMQISLSLSTIIFTAIGAFYSYEFLNISSASLVIFFLLICPFLPETPYYYLLRERNDDAMKCLMKLRGVTSPDKLEAEMREIKLVIDEDRKNTRNLAFLELLSKSYNRKGLMILFCMRLTQTLSGGSCITHYAEDIFSHSSLSIKAGYQAVIYHVAALSASLCTNIFIDRVNRRFLFLSSGVSCAICLACVGIFFFMKFHLEVDTSFLAWLPLVALSLLAVAYQCGIGVIPYISLGELFPIQVKSSAVCLVRILGAISGFGTASGYKPLSNNFGTYTTFWFFALTTFVGSLLTIWIAPNTTGMTLEEIQAMQNPELAEKLKLERADKVSGSDSKKRIKV